MEVMAVAIAEPLQPKYSYMFLESFHGTYTLPVAATHVLLRH